MTKYKYYFRKPRSEIVKDILKTLAMSGAICIAASSPYFVVNLFKSFKQFRKYKGKKKLAEFFVLICGILLIFLSLSNSLWLMLIISFLVGISASFCWPLKDAVFSDVVNRMGIEGKHMIGLSGSTASLAYVLGPIISGFITTIVGEKNTFVAVGMILAFSALTLLVVTPKKMRLPQEEISEWG